jgi:hypothetical protein
MRGQLARPSFCPDRRTTGAAERRLAVNSSLPAAPSLEHLRKQAKELLRAHRAGEPPALSRIDRHNRRGTAELRLADAQLVIAREHGFRSWPRLKAYVERVTAHGSDLRHPFRADVEYFEERAAGLLSAAQGGVPEASELFRRHGPGLGAETGDVELTIDDARLVLARQHGFAAWPALEAHLRSLRHGDEEPFMRGVEAIRADDHAALRALFGRYPGLMAARGTNGNDLLGLATASCRVEGVRILLELGSDPAAANDRGWTALHQAAYMNHEDLTRLLLDAGAPTGRSGHGDGGTPLVVALFWGHREAAELIAARDLAPGNLRVAAGLGRLEMIDGLIAPDGRLAPAAGAHRGFYRPHTGFPVWRPSGDPQEVLDEALVWAAKSGRLEAMTVLVQRGAALEADPYRGTPLAWAAAKNRTGAIRLLLEMGADVNGRSTFGGDIEGATALHLAAQAGHLDAIRALLDAGADPTVIEPSFNSSPSGWAEHFGREEARKLIVERLR